MGIPLQDHSPYCRCRRPDCKRRGMSSANRHRPARSIRHTVSRIDPPSTSAIDNPVQLHPTPCLCRRPTCQRRRTAPSNRRLSERPISRTPSRINLLPTSSIYHPLRLHPVLSSAPPPSTFNTPTSQFPSYETNEAWPNGQTSLSESRMLPDSRSEQRNPHVQSGNNNSNAEGHLEGMMGTHGNSSRPTNSLELDRMDFNRRHYDIDQSLEQLSQIMQEVANIVPTNPHTRQQERQSPSVRQEQSEYSGPRDILNEPQISIRAFNALSLLEHSNMPVSTVRRRQASQQMRDLSYSFGRFDEPVDEGGFHQSIVSQENSTNNHPRTRRQEVLQRRSTEQEQLNYFSHSPPHLSAELTSNFYAADRDSVSPLLLPSRTEMVHFAVQQHVMYNEPRTLQARLRERARMEAAQAPENKNTDLETNTSTNNNTGS
ncbi:98b84334-5deb-4c81-b96c-3a951ae7e266-CDS [Sclerotinia trifoliorum]|uniref:98b84334-5deb-4c81-b96c-3a951ae7e266-CDS n=1 Tax=Sclerotinia trifoliorum TaxID=28548 RepID=A0A8H2VVR0_9HELO|nr:98b84334-5deb-4c81-b96c-3a951ae7e266-CDS [Sclerotinia trifoliorum]